MSKHTMTSTVGLPVSRQQAEQWSFVLGAVNIPSIIEFEQHSWVVKVSPVHAKRALQEIAAYVEEESDWPPNRPAPKVQKLVFSKYQPPTILMMGALVAFYLFTGPWSLKSGWFVNGAVSGRQILENGEWWRLVTALTLHADVMHIFGNVLIGGVLVHLLCRLLGNGLGWFLILVSGILGNFLNVFLRGYMHNSVGFSTAIFGTIGILAGYQAVRKRTTAAREISSFPWQLAAACWPFSGPAANGLTWEPISSGSWSVLHSVQPLCFCPPSVFWSPGQLSSPFSLLPPCSLSSLAGGWRWHDKIKLVMIALLWENHFFLIYCSECITKMNNQFGTLK